PMSHLLRSPAGRSFVVSLALQIPVLTGLALALPVAFGQQPEQQQPTSIIQEIIVTAQRREEQIQDIPLAVTAFNEDQLDTLQVDQALDMGRVVPNFIAHNNTGLGTANS